MRTGQVAKQAGVNIQTLRYYERRGLLPPPPRRDSGYRSYGSDAVDLVRFLKQARALGFSLREASLVHQLMDQPGGPEQAIEFATCKLAELDDKLHHLQLIRDELAECVASYQKRSARRVGQAAS